jgi:Ca2+-binding RTX toxin-like protein
VTIAVNQILERTIKATQGNDTLRGTGDNDVIRAGRGNDTRVPDSGDEQTQGCQGA